MNNSKQTFNLKKRKKQISNSEQTHEQQTMQC